ncbi:helix-turn-helix domain-containing protein [uncultured Bacteroides sp.]|uniref:helix-turn-helix domain-containing protein n=1 Tax=uncultured Bacteroides sp. TaxID=162156 RepID=UPI002AAAABFA|nr:helix-turn-helix domain-containing protein [uncultured Bacteroides sp.]
MANIKEPIELTLKRVNDYRIVAKSEYRFITTDFAIVDSFKQLDSSLFGIKRPYRMKEGRIIYVTSGWMHASINLIEHNFHSGDVAIFSPDSIVEIIEYNDDFDMKAIVIGKDFIQYTKVNDTLEHYITPRQNVKVVLNPKEQEQIEAYFSLIWSTVHESLFRREVVQNLTSALLFNISYIRKNNMRNLQTQLSHQEELFHRFIALVNKFSSTERNVSFYADRLYLTPRYLNTVIKQTSHQTVMEWINQSTIMEAKILLKHSNLLVYEISDRLNFANPSFFCKFFKKMTGITPLTYQREK